MSTAVFEELAVHAKPEACTRPSSSSRPDREEFPEESDRGLAVLDVPRSVLHSEDVTGLAQVRRDRVVARNLAVMRVVAAEGSLDLHAGREHGTVDINGQGPAARYPDNGSTTTAALT